MGPCGKTAAGHEESNHTSGCCSCFAIRLSESGRKWSAGFSWINLTICLQLQECNAHAKRISVPHAITRELRDGMIKSSERCGDARFFVRNRMPHSAKSTPKAVRSHTVCPTPHFSVEDGAKTEIRVGRVLLMNGDEVRALRFERNATQRKRTVLAVGSHISQLSTVCPTPEHFR